MASITLKGNTYPILFDITAVEKIQERYDSIEKIAEKITDRREICWILALIMTEGQKLQAMEFNVPGRIFTEDDLAVLLTIGDMSNTKLIDSIVEALNESLGDGKNLTAEQLTLVGKKMLLNQ